MTSLRARLGRVGARVAPGGGGFLSWWGRALAAWLPRRWRILFGLERGRLLLAPATGADGIAEVRLRLQEDADLRDLGQVPLPASPWPDALPADAATADPFAHLLSPALADLPRWLVLPAADALRRRLVLPAAAVDRLREVVGFEIDRQTPFPAEAVAYDARVVGRRGDAQVEVELVAVPRTAVQAGRQALGPLDRSLAGIDVAGADGLPVGVNLLAPAERRHVADPWRGWNLALAGVALLTLALALWQVLDNRRDAADAFEQALAPRAQQARQAAIQRQQLQALVEGQAFLDQARAARPAMVEVLDELARRLPDSTYLEKISVEDDRLLIIGLSAEASALVRRLEASSLWRSPALTGALQPDPRTGRDRFTLTAQLVAPPAPGAAPVTDTEAGDAAAR
ncbi:PilN domain-containing protein [Luteimonas pelagia]